MQRLVRFARFWDMIANSGRFANTLPLILGGSPFARFIALADWIYAKTNATHQIALARLASLVTTWLTEQGLSSEHVQATIDRDYALSLIHISEPTRLRRISYAVFCLKKK